jgi:hypothetical protein
MKYALAIVALLFALGVSPQLTTLVHERREDQTKLNPAKSESQVEPLRLVKTMEVPGVSRTICCWRKRNWEAGVIWRGQDLGTIHQIRR